MEDKNIWLLEKEKMVNNFGDILINYIQLRPLHMMTLSNLSEKITNMSQQITLKYNWLTW